MPPVNARAREFYNNRKLTSPGRPESAERHVCREIWYCLSCSQARSNYYYYCYYCYYYYYYCYYYYHYYYYYYNCYY